MATNTLPTFDKLMNPLLRALQKLGGSGSIEEIYDKFVEVEQLPEDVLSIPHDPENTTQTEVAYRLGWARTYLKKYGLLENSSRGIWALTAKANGVNEVNPQEVVKAVRASSKKNGESSDTEKTVVQEAAADEEWKQKLHRLLTKSLRRLCTSSATAA
jgi:restriction system protein